MIEAYVSGSDLHSKTVDLIYKGRKPKDEDEKKRWRTNAKATNFGFIYGMTAKGFIDYAKSYGLDLTLEESEQFRNNFINAYPSLPKWWEEMKSYANTYGYSKTLTGRKRFLPDIWSSDFKKKSSAERQAVNSPVQGFASDLCISALADVVFSEELDHDKFHVLGTVHDAILIEVKEEYAEELGKKVAEIMAKPSLISDLELPVPFTGDVEIHSAWGAHD